MFITLEIISGKNKKLSVPTLTTRAQVTHDPRNLDAMETAFFSQMN